MATVYDVSPDELIAELTIELKGVEELKPPVWAAFARTGTHKERPPVNPEWWHVRAAAVLRKIYLLGPIGVGKLRTKYGGSKNRGVKPSRFAKGSGSIIRTVLQQLQKAGLVEEQKKGIHRGRIMTNKGKSMLDKLATKVSRSQVKPVALSQEKKAPPEKKVVETPKKDKPVKKPTKEKENVPKKDD